MQLKFKKGFSLAEIIVAVLITSLVGITLLSLNESANRDFRQIAETNKLQTEAESSNDKKKKLKLKVKEREKEKADEYKGVKITPDFDVDAFPVVPLVAQNADPVLIPFRDEGKNLYSIGDEIIPPEDIEESRELTRKYRERSDKGIRRGFYKPTLDKNKADDFRREQIFRNQDSVVRSDETLLRDIFGDWRQTTTDSIAL